jgi:hypothetical protein
MRVVFKQTLEIKQIQTELEQKRLLCESEAKWRKIVGNLDAKRRAAVNERDIALHEKRLVVAQNELLMIQRNSCVEKIKMLQKKK